MWSIKPTIMGVFTRNDLVKQTYTWSADKGDNPKLKGEPDSSLLNRSEGYEVLYMINKIMVSKGLSTVSSGQKIEKMIHATPSDQRSQVNVKNWINDNWHRY